jgi:hypothetical protein
MTDKQREEIVDYIENRPQIMPGSIRQIRFQIKGIDLDQVIEDVEILNKLSSIKVPIGRKSNEVKAGFRVKEKS